MSSWFYKFTSGNVRRILITPKTKFNPSCKCSQIMGYFVSFPYKIRHIWKRSTGYQTNGSYFGVLHGAIDALGKLGGGGTNYRGGLGSKLLPGSVVVAAHHRYCWKRRGTFRFGHAPSPKCYFLHSERWFLRVLKVIKCYENTSTRPTGLQIDRPTGNSPGAPYG